MKSVIKRLFLCFVFSISCITFRSPTLQEATDFIYGKLGSGLNVVDHC